MADDLQNYKLQLQQVEAALLTDPENTELLKLRQDLEEVIDLTKDLIRAQQEAEQKKSTYIEPTNNSYFESLIAAAEKKQTTQPLAIWKVGDKCSAKWIEDGKYYDATIEAIIDNGEVNIVFDAYQNRSTTTVGELKKRKVDNEVFPSNSNKRMRPNQKEYLRKKKQKKLIRMKELDEEKESEKNNWLQFSAKNAKKTGVKHKSIFASSEHANGRVGIGTCGVSGKPMTDFSHGKQYRKGM
ncbi:survival of motor neuron-related-splicing factor 30-like [Toxorhynchites rutilus septentrionalis]|uniref:survival of motor neuron-related-splicing factor 30-like n=1 Tax=Toxorhynchites rutilus septentrionalis TaxID=329112 RepID=UPI002479CF4E|nr:survival of motor neuron-related-splicing factor 30-like [Toxorhynchites rutilus septentrionalis]